MNADQLLRAATVAEEHATEVSKSSPDHGPRHWRDVARIAWSIGEEANPVIFLFAALHDTQRESEFFDPEHGGRAAKMAAQMAVQRIIAISDEQFELLDYALTDHDSGAITTDPEIAVCWDADRLTLPRVGIVPDSTFFSVPKVRNDLSLWVAGAMEIVNGDDISWEEIAKVYD